MDSLRKLAQRKREKLAAEALQSDGVIDKLEFEQLERLDRMAAQTGHQRRWLIPAILILGAAFGFGIQFGPRETDLDLDVSVSEFAFTLDGTQPLVAGQRITSLSADGVEKIEFDSGDALPGPRGTSPCFLTLQLPAKPSAGDTITLGQLKAPTGTRVRLSRANPEIRWAFEADPETLKREPLEPLPAVLTGTTSLQATCGTETVRRTFPGKALIRAYFRPGFGINFVTDRPQFEPEVGVRTFTFSQRQDLGSGLIRDLSGLQGGTLYLNDLAGRSIALRPSERLAFDGSRGEIRSLAAKADEDGFRLQAHAVASGMRTGSRTAQWNRMPRWLEWIVAQEWFKSLSIVLLSIAIPLLRWLKIIG